MNALLQSAQLLGKMVPVALKITGTADQTRSVPDFQKQATVTGTTKGPVENVIRICQKSDLSDFVQNLAGLEFRLSGTLAEKFGESKTCD